MVFEKREEAFKVLKTHSDARVKGFQSREEACRFAQFGQDLNLNQSFNDSSKMLKCKWQAMSVHRERENRRCRQNDDDSRS